MFTEKIIIILIFITNLSLAQNFFPLKVGNIYQYREDWFVWAPGGYTNSGSDYYRVLVTRDSLYGGDIFFEISKTGSGGPFPNNYFFIYDSLNQKVLMKIPQNDTTRLAFDFNIPTGSSFISYIRGEPNNFGSGGLSSEIILGDTHTVYSMTNLDWPPYTYKIANKIGLSNFEYFDGNINHGIESTHYLISAIIDSVAINPLVLQIDSIYPVIDRPIDTFPFLLSIPYTASYHALVDSFYLSLEIIREDTTFQSYHYDLSISNPKQTLYFEDLEVGDKLKLRASITDTSIYNNIDHYPDSGWALINVLPPILNVEGSGELFAYSLEQNYPNPFNPTTTIKYQIPELSFITLKVYDVLGKEIAILVNEEQPAGIYEVEFNSVGISRGLSLPSGVYFYKLTAGEFVKTKKMILAK